MASRHHPSRFPFSPFQCPRGALDFFTAMKRNAQLVCQHLENISREALEKYQTVIRQFVRGRHGIYALYRHDRLYYVGLATDLRTRLKQHLRDRHADSWDRFSVYLTIGDQHLRELEALILRTVMPEGNKQKGKFAKSENILSRFLCCCNEEIQDLVGARNPVCRKSARKKPNGRSPVLAKYISAAFPIRVRFKGKLIRAQVRRDGTIRFNGKIYNSPAGAGAAACKRVSCNGWTFWTYERAPGDWVPLDALRS